MLLDKSQRPRILLLFIGLVLLGYAFYRAFLTTQQAIADMVAQGWGSYLGLDSSALGPFSFSCLSSADCSQPFMDYWSANYAWWLLILAMVCLLASTLMMFLVDSLPTGAGKAPGGATWAKDNELASLLKPGKGSYASPLRGYLGHTMSGKLLTVPENKRNAHSLIIGGPGSGKTTRYFKQNLLKDAVQGMSAVVLDLKYPDARGGFFDMVPFFEKQGSDVQLFLPFDDKTLSMPLLLGADTFEGASEFARMVVPVDLEGGDSEFYKNQERKLLTGLVMALTRTGETSLRKLYRLLVAGTQSVANFVQSVGDREVQELFKSFFELDSGKLAGIVNGLEGKLQIFYDETLDKSTTLSDYPWENVNLDALGTKPSLLYIGIPQEKLLSGDGKLLLQLIKRTLDRAMLKNARANNGSLPIATSFYLDEFPSFGELPNMEENFATMRSYKVGYHVAIQNRAQLESVYGRETANALLTNLFQHIIFFPRYLKFDDATFFSEALGEMTAIEESRGRRASVALLDLQQNTVNRKEVAVPLMSPEEMMSWPDAVGVVIANGMPPIKTLMPRLDETHVQGKPNLLHQYYEILKRNTPNVVQLRNELLLRRQATMFRQLAPTGALTEIMQAKQQRKEKAVRVVAPSTSELKTSFLTWLDQLIELKPATTLFREEGTDKITKIAIHVTTLPQEIKEPPELKDWSKQRLLKVQGERYGLVGETLSWLGSERKAALVALEQFAQKKIESKPPQSTPTPKATPKPNIPKPNMPKRQAAEATFQKQPAPQSEIIKQTGAEGLEVPQQQPSTSGKHPNDFRKQPGDVERAVTRQPAQQSITTHESIAANPSSAPVKPNKKKPKKRKPNPGTVQQAMPHTPSGKDTQVKVAQAQLENAQPKEAEAPLPLSQHPISQHPRPAQAIIVQPPVPVQPQPVSETQSQSFVERPQSEGPVDVKAQQLQLEPVSPTITLGDQS
ncbi:MAG: type IV secretory system conjugative DNA transfer family protein [Trueperaceae bacterium]